MKLVILSGAGLSAESGIATFRDSKDGTWANKDPMKIANYDTWHENFDEVHDFYNHRRTELIDKKPNAAHYKIAEWQKKYPVVNFTQNVDLLLEAAGCTDVFHIHGKLNEMACTNCRHVWEIDLTEYDTNSGCPECGETTSVKPNVVFFNEYAPLYKEFYGTVQNGGMRKRDIFLCIGTAGNVIPVNQISISLPSITIANVLNLDRDHEGLYPPLNPSDWTYFITGPATAKVEDIDKWLQHHFRR